MNGRIILTAEEMRAAEAAGRPAMAVRALADERGERGELAGIERGVDPREGLGGARAEVAGRVREEP